MRVIDNSQQLSISKFYNDRLSLENSSLKDNNSSIEIIGEKLKSKQIQIDTNNYKDGDKTRNSTIKIKKSEPTKRGFNL